MIFESLMNIPKKPPRNKRAEESPRELKSRCAKKSDGEKVCASPASRGNASPRDDEDSPVSGPRTRSSWGILQRARELVKSGTRNWIYNSWLAKQLDCSNSVVGPIIQTLHKEGLLNFENGRYVVNDSASKKGAKLDSAEGQNKTRRTSSRLSLKPNNEEEKEKPKPPSVRRKPEPKQVTHNENTTNAKKGQASTEKQLSKKSKSPLSNFKKKPSAKSASGKAAHTESIRRTRSNSKPEDLKQDSGRTTVGTENEDEGEEDDSVFNDHLAEDESEKSDKLDLQLDGSENSADSRSSDENEPQRQVSLFRGRTLLKRRSSGDDSLNKRKRVENTPSSESDFEKTENNPLDAEDAEDDELFPNEKETQVSEDLDDVLDEYVGTGTDDPTQPPNYCSQQESAVQMNRKRLAIPSQALKLFNHSYSDVH